MALIFSSFEILSENMAALKCFPGNMGSRPGSCNKRPLIAEVLQYQTASGHTKALVCILGCAKTLVHTISGTRRPKKKKQ